MARQQTRMSEPPSKKGDVVMNQIDEVMRLYPNWRLRLCQDDMISQAYGYRAMIYGTLNISDNEFLGSAEGVSRRNVPLTVWVHKNFADMRPSVRIQVPPGEKLMPRSYLKNKGKISENKGKISEVDMKRVVPWRTPADRDLVNMLVMLTSLFSSEPPILRKPGQNSSDLPSPSRGLRQSRPPPSSSSLSPGPDSSNYQASNTMPSARPSSRASSSLSDSDIRTGPLERRNTWSGDDSQRREIIAAVTKTLEHEFKVRKESTEIGMVQLAMEHSRVTDTRRALLHAVKDQKSRSPKSSDTVDRLLRKDDQQSRELAKQKKLEREMGSLNLSAKEPLQLQFSAYENKLVEWRATDLALHDVMAVLSDACAEGLLSSERYLTVVERTAREQFMARASYRKLIFERASFKRGSV